MVDLGENARRRLMHGIEPGRQRLQSALICFFLQNFTETHMDQIVPEPLKSGSPAAQATQNWVLRLGRIRHDLRNPLSEIIISSCGRCREDGIN